MKWTLINNSNITSDLISAGKHITTMIISKGITGKIQPLDIYGFRIWKNFAKRFSGIVSRLESNINLHIRCTTLLPPFSYIWL